MGKQRTEAGATLRLVASEVIFGTLGASGHRLGEGHVKACELGNVVGRLAVDEGVGHSGRLLLTTSGGLRRLVSLGRTASRQGERSNAEQAEERATVKHGGLLLVCGRVPSCPTGSKCANHKPASGLPGRPDAMPSLTHQRD